MSSEPREPIFTNREKVLIWEALRYRGGILLSERGTAPMAEQRRAVGAEYDALANRLNATWPDRGEGTGL